MALTPISTDQTISADQGFNISNFTEHLNQTGTIQTNRYFCNFMLPALFQKQTRFKFQYPLDRLLQFRAEQVRIPGITLDTIDNRTYGVGINKQFTTNARFSKMHITFLENKASDIFKLFYLWTTSAFDYTGIFTGVESQPQYSVAYRNDIVQDISITVCDNLGNISKNIKVIEAFPTAIDDTTVDWSDTDKLYRVSVEFSFKRWQLIQ